MHITKIETGTSVGKHLEGTEPYRTVLYDVRSTRASRITLYAQIIIRLRGQFCGYIPTGLCVLSYRYATLESNMKKHKLELSDEENMNAFNRFTPGYPYRPDINMEEHIPDSCPNKAKVGGTYSGLLGNARCRSSWVLTVFRFCVSRTRPKVCGLRYARVRAPLVSAILR